MTNTELFGKTHTYTRKQAVKDGYLLDVELVQLRTEKELNQSKVAEYGANFISETLIPYFRKEKPDINGKLINNYEDNMVLLTRFKTRDESRTNFESDNMVSFVNNGGHIFYVDGDNMYHNSVANTFSNREEFFFFMEDIIAKGNDVIIFNCGVMDEGIDVNGTNITVDFSNIENKQLAVQFTGRVRPLEEDFYIRKGLLVLKPLRERKRPTSILIIPNIENSDNNYLTIKGYLNDEDMLCHFNAKDKSEPKGKLDFDKEGDDPFTLSNAKSYIDGNRDYQLCNVSEKSQTSLLVGFNARLKARLKQA